MSRGTIQFLYLRFMARKRWSAQQEITPGLLVLREKRKWQIALRRYVLEENPCINYAPYFGLDIQHFRKWVSLQFTKEMTWDNFGKAWQFEHVVPVVYFDFSKDIDLKLCWNFVNIRVESIKTSKSKTNWSMLTQAKSYFESLFEKTGYSLCYNMIGRINQIELAESASPNKQIDFIIQNKEYLSLIESYSSFEFELLNSGKTIPEVNREINFLKKF